jgi:hypothetical protein
MCSWSFPSIASLLERMSTISDCLEVRTVLSRAIAIADLPPSPGASTLSVEHAFNIVSAETSPVIYEYAGPSKTLKGAHHYFIPETVFTNNPSALLTKEFSNITGIHLTQTVYSSLPKHTKPAPSTLESSPGFFSPPQQPEWILTILRLLELTPPPIVKNAIEKQDYSSLLGWAATGYHEKAIEIADTILKACSTLNVDAPGLGGKSAMAIALDKTVLTSKQSEIVDILSRREAIEGKLQEHIEEQCRTAFTELTSM